ncbi:hypothetical protein LOOC260_109920 [Paucilactobacillus hokkaidonensis JCM 18461]|uniref:Phage protein n=2 Tax=Paucilactobacillus hokkaidonensis TaxID=1193095 RepID=A0A0A1GYH9_9LACO|nr:hypothetical protein [Paucilactobacillus hokkaidonensis]KRO09801.1 hypothetical protein IV59_GL000415 [Paucilactobacillus hokkaidonensis]BAP85531.1 hypothetical protein LOOC260_109920 [Paucilactobacillus hokkaidonensis JCM 18461]
MSKPVKIDLMINGELKHFEDDFVPFSKHIEMLEMNEKVSEGETSQVDWFKQKAAFVASLFRDPEVTGKSVINGLSAATADDDMETVIAEMLGIDPNEVAEIPTA